MPMMSQPPKEFPHDLSPLDEADMKIIELLSEDGRMSGRDIAQRAGLSEANVSRRLARLIEEGSLRILAMVPAQMLGLNTRCLLLVRCKGDPSSTAERLGRIPHVHWCGSAFGAFDVVLYACVRDNERLIDLVDDICGTDTNIEDVVVCPVLEFLTPKPHTDQAVGLAPSRKLDGVRQPDLDQVDRALIYALQANGRASFAELAEASGISATSAADRFRRLQADGVVSIITLPSPPRIGNLVRATACLRTRGSIRSVLEHAASLPGTLWPCACGGPFGVILDFACANERALNEMRAKFIAIPGVTHVDLSLHRRIFRDDLRWGFEDGPPKPVSRG